MEFKNKYNLNNKFIIMYSGNVGLYYEEEYKGILLEKAEQQKQQQEKEQMYKELSEMVDIIYNAKNEQEAIEKLEKFGVKGYRM